MKQFHEHWAEWMAQLVAVLNSISDDRRKWTRLQMANRLLFRSAASFFFYSCSPTRNESALNEAIELRASAMQLYEDEYDRCAADAETICREFDVKAPIKIDRKKEKKMSPRVLKRQGELKLKRKRENIRRKKIQPALKGFLDGAVYEKFDLMPSEGMNERAGLSAKSAIQAMLSKIENDCITCADEYQESFDEDDEEGQVKWDKELLLAEEDEKLVQAFYDQHFTD